MAWRWPWDIRREAQSSLSVRPRTESTPTPAPGGGRGSQPAPKPSGGGTSAPSPGGGRGSQPGPRPSSSAPAPSSKPRPGAGRGSSDALRSNRNPNDSRVQQWLDKEQASAGTQRYFRARGWRSSQPPAPVQSDDDFQFDETSSRGLRPHYYSLSPWQMQQAEADYGIEASDKRVGLMTSPMRSATVGEAAYNAMSPAQRNALEFNRLLIEARTADLATARPQDVGDYDARAIEMFGSQGVSHTYAPNTLALLEGMGMGRLRGQDLDEYLSLDRAYDTSEIRALKDWDGPAPIYGSQGFGKDRTKEKSLLLDRRQSALIGDLITKAASDQGLPGWDVPSRTRGLLGLPLQEGWRSSWRTLEEVQADTAAPNTEKLAAFYWNEMRDKAVDPVEALNMFWIDVQDFGLSEEEGESVLDDIFQRTYVEPYGDEQYLSGAELRAALGMEG